MGEHLEDGSPVKPCLQLHIGLWFITSQRVFIPQVPGQGSEHFWFIQALLGEHSALTKHSGRQAGGIPIYDVKQEQTAWSLTTLHWLFGPQGDGLQGSAGEGTGMSENIHVNNYCGIYKHRSLCYLIYHFNL